jgi:hypothetical protein
VSAGTRGQEAQGAEERDGLSSVYQEKAIFALRRTHGLRMREGMRESEIPAKYSATLPWGVPDMQAQGPEELSEGGQPCSCGGQGLLLIRHALYLLSHAPNPFGFLGYFSDRVLIFARRCQTMIILPMPPQ